MSMKTRVRALERRPAAKAGWRELFRKWYASHGPGFAEAYAALGPGGVVVVETHGLSEEEREKALEAKRREAPDRIGGGGYHWPIIEIDL